MKLLTSALVGLSVLAAEAFGPASTGTGAAPPRPSVSSLRAYGGMDAYDAQMKSLAAAAAAPVATAVAPAAPASAESDSYKSSPRWRKKTKQLATLGPASCTFEMIEKLFLAGADVFRLNFSHGEHAQKKELLDIIRSVEAKYDHPIAILGDLQGPKLRVGTFANPAGEMLRAGQTFRFDLNEVPGTDQRVLLPHPEIIEASEVGHVLLVDDGKVTCKEILIFNTTLRGWSAERSHSSFSICTTSSFT